MNLATRMSSLALVFCLATPLCMAGTPRPADDHPTVNGRSVKAAEKPLTYQQQVEKARKGAHDLARTIAAEQRAYLKKSSTKKAFRSMANDIIDVGEKMSQAGELLNSGNGTYMRMQKSFRRQVMDDTKLLAKWNEALAQLQQQLMADTYQLYRLSGRPIETGTFDLPHMFLKSSFCPNPFDGLFRGAAAVAQSDWIREIAVFAGAQITGSAAQDVAEGLGILEADSVLSSLFGVAVDALATQMINEVQDPAGEITKDLQKGYDTLCDRVIHSTNGFADVCEYITQQHLQFRLQLLGLKAPAQQKVGGEK